MSGLAECVMETKDMLYIVTEYAGNGEMFDYLTSNGRLSEDEARNKFWQVLQAVDYCHRHHIVHRDLKTENLLLDNNMNIKLADFGFGNFYKAGEPLSTWCGSPPYAAPEVFEGKQYEGPHLDVWSLGVVLYVLVCGSLPFDGPSLPALRQRVTEGRFRIPFFMSEDCENLVRKMLTIDPAKRISIAQVKQHRWMLADPTSLHQNLSMVLPTTDYNSNLGDYSQPVLGIMQTLGIDRHKTIESLQTSSYNHFSAIYYLLLERFREHRTQQLSVQFVPWTQRPRSTSDSGNPEVIQEDGFRTSASPIQLQSTPYWETDLLETSIIEEVRPQEEVTHTCSPVLLPSSSTSRRHTLAERPTVTPLPSESSQVGPRGTAPAFCSNILPQAVSFQEGRRASDTSLTQGLKAFRQQLRKNPRVKGLVGLNKIKGLARQICSNHGSRGSIGRTRNEHRSMLEEVLYQQRMLQIQHQSPLLQHLSPLPQHQSPLPQHQSPLPQHQSPYPNTRAPAPTPEPLPQHQSPLPQHQSPCPNTRAPCPNTRSPAPTPEPLPQHQSPLPQHQSPLPQHQSPLPQHQSPLPQHQSPLPQHQSPLPQHQSPLAQHQSPLPLLHTFWQQPLEASSSSSGSSSSCSSSSSYCSSSSSFSTAEHVELRLWDRDAGASPLICISSWGSLPPLHRKQEVHGWSVSEHSDKQGKDRHSTQ
ncbi:hypothetical protein DPEC_G00053230 [Dallia pectoralis]|uniref:Uncharacterized protein n=1 Tax=Dallia pectoralis TaxID=75939 RepID=A0ACC2HCP2_DALPE|nr:hypothetical protein DPEC_G00053230 [Dallia pectoralis]